MKLQRFKVSEATLKEAKRRFDNFPLINNSIRQREGGLVGYIRQALVMHLQGGEKKDTYEYDIINAEGLKIDVKTKERKVAPRSNYNCTVADFNTNQKCDRYSFVSVLEDYKSAWYLGSISKKDFYEKAVFYKQGDLDPESSPRYPFKFTADCYNIKVSELER